MDADNRIIPLVGDDQGEGFKDPINTLEDIPEHLRKAYKDSLRKAEKEQQRILSKMLNKK